ncbi:MULTISPECIES: hypothetical protein [unclassified Rhizobium]
MTVSVVVDWLGTGSRIAAKGSSQMARFTYAPERQAMSAHAGDTDNG